MSEMAQVKNKTTVIYVRRMPGSMVCVKVVETARQLMYKMQTWSQGHHMQGQGQGLDL